MDQTPEQEQKRPQQLQEEWNNEVPHKPYLMMTQEEQKQTVAYFTNRYETIGDVLLRTRVQIRDIHFYDDAHPLAFLQ